MFDLDLNTNLANLASDAHGPKVFVFSSDFDISQTAGIGCIRTESDGFLFDVSCKSSKSGVGSVWPKSNVCFNQICKEIKQVLVVPFQI